MTDTTSRGADRTRNKHLELAYSYVRDAWFPIDPALLAKIQDNLYRGLYDNDRSRLVEDLKQDSSLLLYCIGRLAEIMRLNPAAASTPRTPAHLLQETPLAEFRAILAVQPYGVSTHHADETKTEHVRRYENGVVAATTAEALASSYAINGSDAYSCALIRQLGLTLIAWNYPHVYNRVFSSLKPGEDPGQVLEKMLGFSPQALALTIAQRWELAPEILQSLSPSEQCTDEEVRKSGKVIAHVCAIGEAFADSIEKQASVSDPDRWKDALDEISKILGPDGTTHLKLLIRRNLSSYARNHPVLSPWAITTESAPQSGSLKAPLPRRELKASELLERNLYVKRCSDAAQTLFKELYDALEPTGISKASLDVLRTKIIPHFGFQRGCIYLLEPVSMVLSPRFVLGKSKTSDYEGVRYNSSQAAFDPIAAAFSSKTPSIEEKQGERSEKICYIACSLGDLQRAGVLYLELSNEQLENHRGTNPLIAFKAIRHVLADILMLK